MIFESHQNRRDKFDQRIFPAIFCGNLIGNVDNILVFRNVVSSLVVYALEPERVQDCRTQKLMKCTKLVIAKDKSTDTFSTKKLIIRG